MPRITPSADALLDRIIADPERRLRILTIDGGPSPNVSIRLLETIETENPGFARSIDVLAGTSDGSYMALYLAAHLTDDDATNLQVIRDCRGFLDEILDVFDSSCLNVLGFVSGLLPVNWAIKLRRVLDKHLGSITPSQLGRNLIVVSYDKTLQHPRIFNTLSKTSFDQEDWTLVDLARASSAFPTLLPIFKSPAGAKHLFLDGALVDNNPTMCAVARAVEFLGDDKVGDSLQRITALSLGSVESGKPANCLSKVTEPLLNALASDHSLYWGWIAWMIHDPMYNVNLISQGSTIEVSDQARALLRPTHYHRSKPELSIAKIGFGLTFLGIPVKKWIALMDSLARKAETTPEFATTMAWVRASWMRGAPLRPSDG